MRSPIIPALIVAASVGPGALSAAAQVLPDGPPPPTHLGVQASATAGVNWLSATESVDAVGLSTYPVEVGGSALVTGIWRDLFAQVSASRWSSDGERAFVSSDGSRFPLGIPLDVKATFIDASVGWDSLVRSGRDGRDIIAYAGAGAGVVKYSEKSPFAEDGDDVDETAASYHFLAGVEVRLLKWVGIAGDVRFRYVPGLLGDDGASGALDERGFHNLQVGVGVRIGFRGSPRQRVEPPEQPPAPRVPPPPDTGTPPARKITDRAVIVKAAPVFLLPDANRKPLRILDAGTNVDVLDVTEEWVRVAFEDRALGRRIGYVQRKDIVLPK